MSRAQDVARRLDRRLRPELYASIDREHARLKEKVIEAVREWYTDPMAGSAWYTDPVAEPDFGLYEAARDLIAYEREHGLEK